MNYSLSDVVVPQGAFIPASVDDWTGGEWATVIVGAVVHGLDIVAIMWLWLNRRVRYIKVLSVDLLVVFVFACILFWFTTMTSNFVIPAKGAFLVCSWWNEWLYLPLSLSLLLIVMISRFWRLHTILVQGKELTFVRSFLFPFLLWLPGVAISIAGTVTGSLGPFNLDFNGTLIVACKTENTFVYINAAYLLLLLLVYFIIAYQLHRVRHRIYQEYNKSLWIVAVVVASTIVVVAVSVTGNYFFAWGRTLIVFAAIFGSNYAIWAYIGSAVYNVTFRHEEALKEFEKAIASKVLISVSMNTESTVESGFGRFLHGRAAAALCCWTAVAPSGSTRGSSTASYNKSPSSDQLMKGAPSAEMQMLASRSLENVDQTINDLSPPTPKTPVPPAPIDARTPISTESSIAAPPEPSAETSISVPPSSEDAAE